MAVKTILDARGDTIKTVVSDHHDSDRWTYVTEQDLEATFKSIAQKKENIGKDFKPVAEIPAVIVEQMMRDGSFNDPDYLKKWLNDPTNKCFRIWEGKV